MSIRGRLAGYSRGENKRIGGQILKPEGTHRHCPMATFRAQEMGSPQLEGSEPRHASLPSQSAAQACWIVADAIVAYRVMTTEHTVGSKDDPREEFARIVPGQRLV